MVFTYQHSQHFSCAKLTMKWLLVSVLVIDMGVTYSCKFMLYKVRIIFIKCICCAFLRTCFWLDLSFAVCWYIKEKKMVGHHIKIRAKRVYNMNRYYHSFMLSHAKNILMYMMNDISFLINISINNSAKPNLKVNFVIMIMKSYWQFTEWDEIWDYNWSVLFSIAKCHFHNIGFFTARSFVQFENDTSFPISGFAQKLYISFYGACGFRNFFSEKTWDIIDMVCSNQYLFHETFYS